jgi:hypothetical protein
MTGCRDPFPEQFWFASGTEPIGHTKYFVPKCQKAKKTSPCRPWSDQEENAKEHAVCLFQDCQHEQVFRCQ